MCGIVAIVGLPKSPERAHRIRAMAAEIQHRGPDSDGFLEEESVAFGFRRLAILDLSRAGNQPMTTADGAISIVFNGEIYNFIELREELTKLGHQFRSSSDTEVLLHAYIEWGSECVRKLNGMWAFLIYDRRLNKIVGSRDRFGMKPLFVSTVGKSWLFASEIKAILASRYIAAKPDWEMIADFVVMDRLDHSESTLFSGITKIPAGSWFELHVHSGLQISRFWEPPTDTAKADRDAPARFAELFEDAMRLHQRSDVPVAVHLSGGLDSTSILCALRRVQSSRDAPLIAFSFMSDAFDERRFIDETIVTTGATLRPLTATALSYWDALEPTLAANDEPVHSMTALVGYVLMRETRAHGIKVVLNGQGADETLAGYPSYFEKTIQELLANLHVWKAFSQMRRYSVAHERQFGSFIASQLAYTLRALLGRTGWYRRIADSRAPVIPANWASRDLIDLIMARPRTTWPLGLKGALKSSIERDPLPTYLRIEDRNAMAHSVESRLPFLDYRLVEMALRMPNSELLDGQWNKWLLRRAMRGRIPESVRTRVDKMGFPVPSSDWLRGPLWDFVESILRDSAVRDTGVFDVAKVDAQLDRFKRGDNSLTPTVFNAVQFVLWWNSIMKADRRDEARTAQHG